MNFRKVTWFRVCCAVLVPGLSFASKASRRLDLASTTDAGVKGNRTSGSVISISADGTKVAFQSFATNLDPTDTDGSSDIYVKDLSTGELALASTSSGGVKANNFSTFPSISADGSKVAFGSRATNLDPLDPDAVMDIYVKDLNTGEVALVSTSDLGVKGLGDSFMASIAGNGLRVAFTSTANNLDLSDADIINDAYVKDLTTGDLILSSTTSDGVKAVSIGGSSQASLSFDGNVLAFTSNAANLDPADGDATSDVYVKHLETGALELASTSDSGSKGNSFSSSPSISGDGTTVAFHSNATNLHALDVNSDYDAYVKQLATGRLTLASVSSVGQKGNGPSILPMISFDGSKIAFLSHSTNLEPLDTDDLLDAYLKDLSTGAIQLLSISDVGMKGFAGTGLRPSGGIAWGAIALASTFEVVAFDSQSTSLHQTDSDSTMDVFVSSSASKPDRKKKATI